MDREDFELASVLKSDADKRELYFNLKAAAESGWDFSSRWFISSKGHNPDGIKLNYHGFLFVTDFRSG